MSADHQIDNDEIDILELFDIIWDSKWVIGAITGIFAVASIGLALLLPPSFEGRLDIAALDKTQMAAYAPLNDTPGISAPIYAGNELIGHTGVMLSEDLFAAFIAALRDGKPFAEAHAALDPQFINFQGTDAERREALRNLREGYNFTVDKTNVQRGVFSFTTGDKELAQKILHHSFDTADQILRQENLRGIANLQKSIETSLAFEIDEIETAIANAVADYETATQAHLAELSEQAAIARQLGISDNQAGLANSSGSAIGINVNSNLPLYLRGYKALEKEISLIKARSTSKSILPYVPNYPELASQLRRLKTDKRLARIEQGIVLTPLADATTFTAADYDLQTLIFKPQRSKALIVVLATLLGGMVAVLFALMRHFIVQRAQTA